jgi:hypothetical protein
MPQSEVEKTASGRTQREWRQPLLRRLPIAATAAKTEGNEGSGQGKGDNRGQVS